MLQPTHTHISLLWFLHIELFTRKTNHDLIHSPSFKINFLLLNVRLTVTPPGAACTFSCCRHTVPSTLPSGAGSRWGCVSVGRESSIHSFYHRVRPHRRTQDINHRVSFLRKQQAALLTASCPETQPPGPRKSGRKEEHFFRMTYEPVAAL